MLVFTRKKHQAFYIGDDVKVTVLEFSRGGIKIGIDAPKDVNIQRAELRAYRETKPATQIRETEHD